eukprot:TRINITY_DN58755_c0_g1_i1.p1 TRINITY_DN58755_c0_g1~~TRINITY_DN58755_c0_g1_i1.p1  ORF type:complete len:384 (+),score=83.12 TRINITY_DN58755_c0_g1_i1:66-1154(+)
MVMLAWASRVAPAALLGTGSIAGHVTGPWLGSAASEALLFALLSAASLPLGGLAGLALHPVNEKVVSRLMSFGAGSLLFAVTVELYGGGLHQIEKFGEQYTNAAVAIHEVEKDSKLGHRLLHSYVEILVSMAACCLGAFFYLRFNRWLKMWAQGKSSASVDESKRTSSLAVDMWAKMIKSGHCNADLASPDHQDEEAPCSEDDAKKYAAAMAIFAGVVVDGIAEGVLIGFMAAHKNLSIDFVFSVFLANIPEAFSTSSMLKDLRRPSWKTMAAWTVLMAITGMTGWLTASILGGVDLDGFGAHVTTGAVEGLAAGAMMMMIVSVMIPEAFEVEGDVSSMFIIIGFLISIGVRVVGGSVEHFA